MPWPTHIVSAGGYVFDNAGNILIVKTTNRGWDCTGGIVEVGENIEEGVLRVHYCSYVTKPEFKVLSSRFI